MILIPKNAPRGVIISARILERILTSCVDKAISELSQNDCKTFGENLTKSKNQIDDLVNVILRNERPVS